MYDETTTVYRTTAGSSALCGSNVLKHAARGLQLSFTMRLANGAYHYSSQLLYGLWHWFISSLLAQTDRLCLRN